MRSLNRNETILTYIALILLILILHQRFLHRHRSLENTLIELQSLNAVLEKRSMESVSREDRVSRSLPNFLDALDDSLIPFDGLSVTQRTDTITFEFNGSTEQLWHMLQVLRTISGVSLEQLEFYESKSGIAGMIELRIIQK